MGSKGIFANTMFLSKGVQVMMLILLVLVMLSWTVIAELRNRIDNLEKNQDYFLEGEDVRNVVDAMWTIKQSEK